MEQIKKMINGFSLVMLVWVTVNQFLNQGTLFFVVLLVMLLSIAEKYRSELTFNLFSFIGIVLGVGVVGVYFLESSWLYLAGIVIVYAVLSVFYREREKTVSK